MADRTIPNDRCREILAHYFGEAAQPDCSLADFQSRTKLWFMRNAETDAEIGRLFLSDVEQAARGELDAWRETPLGRLALVVLLDQFPRNLNRDSARAFDHDATALAVALDGLARGDAATLTEGERMVLYLPLMHAEDVALQVRCSDLYRELAATTSVLAPELQMASKFADRHRHIVERFGRFPHRNKAVGRESTPEELAFLREPNSSF